MFGTGLIGFPVGTLINAYILYVVFCEQGRMVFSDDYHEIIRRTPHIRCRGSILVWILLTITISLMAVALGAPFLLGFLR